MIIVYIQNNNNDTVQLVTLHCMIVNTNNNPLTVNVYSQNSFNCLRRKMSGIKNKASHRTIYTYVALTLHPDAFNFTNQILCCFDTMEISKLPISRKREPTQ